MDIVFGIWADSGTSPDHGGADTGAFGAPTVGPNGLLDILEAIHGFSAPSTAYVVRIAAWQAALEAVDDGTRFWSKSLQVDPWSTARTVLAWRDQLLESGWKPKSKWKSKRLGDIALAEGASSLPFGSADRVSQLICALDPDITKSVRRVRLIDRHADLPAGWRLLLDGLAAQGVIIEELNSSPAAPEGSALGRLQRWMSNGESFGAAADGTITMARSASAALAGEIIGQWFEAVPRDQSLALIVQGSDSQLLDHGFEGAGQPHTGRSRRSPYRGTLQLLLLAFKLSWQPFDAHALMELLLFARSPIAQRAAWRLAAALEEAPGRGGDQWLGAWAAIEEAEMAAATDPKERKAAETRLARWRSWVELVGVDPIVGLPAADVVATCDRVIGWALARFALDGDPLYQSTATLATDVRRALVALARPLYPRTLIERVIDQALDEGHDNPNAVAEAALWRSVTHAGAVWAPVDTLVWWNFVDAKEGVSRAPWTNSERGELSADGCVLDDEGRAGRAVSAAWERAIRNTRGKVIMVAAGLNAHDEASTHPFAHRIAPALAKIVDHIRLEDALDQPTMSLGGIVLPRVEVEPREIPGPQPVWTTPTGYTTRLVDTHQSATSFENLLSCQLMWALRHVARIRPGRARSIPDENRLLGNLAHAVAREVFLPGPPPTPSDAADRTQAILDALIDRLAAPLRNPALASELAFARRRLPDAMAELCRTLVENNLTVAATEQQVSGQFEDALSVRGALDLVARDAAGSPVIIDLKWTRSPKSRLAELQTGTAVQLATYGALLSGEAPYRAGYFLLHQRQFATLAASGLIGRSVDGVRTLPETWAAITVSWKQWTERAHAGTLVATGVAEASAHLPTNLALVREVRCDRCDYSTLCRVRGLQ